MRFLLLPYSFELHLYDVVFISQTERGSVVETGGVGLMMLWEGG